MEGKKPTFDEIVEKGSLNEVGIAYEDENETEPGFIVPENDELRELYQEEYERNHPLQIKVKKATNQTKAKVNSFHNSISNKIDDGKTKVVISTGVIKRKLSIEHLNRYRSSLASSLLIFLLLFTSIKAFGAKSQIEVISKNAKTHLNLALEKIDQGEIADGLIEADKAKEEIKNLKLLAQSWGQDIKYLSLIPSHSSKLVAYERFLNSAYTLLDLSSLFDKTLEKSIKTGLQDSGSEGIPQLDFHSIQVNFEEAVSAALLSLEKCREDLGKASLALPEDLTSQNERAQNIIGRLESSLTNAREVLNTGMPWISGADGKPKKILILFQNNTEMRGTGGFIGSFAVANFMNGKLLNLEFETNIYKLDKEFSSKNKITPPTELAPISQGNWAMRDSNFAINGPESFSKVIEFYEKESGKSAEGVIALDTTLFLKLLSIVGPIEMPEYGKVISDKNFLSDIQYEVDKGYFEREGGKEENEPKKILSEMMPKFIHQLFQGFSDKAKGAKVIAAFGQALKEKHLLFFFENKGLQRKIEEQNLASKVEYKMTDYLYVHNTNIGGSKSSLNMKESIKHLINIDKGGKVTGKIELTRKHEGSGQWPDGANVNLVRVLLPQNSKVSDFRMDEGNFWPHFDKKYSGNPSYNVGEEAGKAKVSFWQNTEPGKRSRSNLEYVSNYKIDTSSNRFTYRLYLQKQPGNLGDEYELELNYPTGFRPVNVKNYDPINHKMVIRYFFNEDKEFSIEFERIKGN